jgi:hypothetical protein
MIPMGEAILVQKDLFFFLLKSTRRKISNENYQLFSRVIALGRYSPHPQSIVSKASEERLAISRPRNRDAFWLPGFIGDFVRGFELVYD